VRDLARCEAIRRAESLDRLDLPNGGGGVGLTWIVRVRGSAPGRAPRLTDVLRVAPTPVASIMYNTYLNPELNCILICRCAMGFRSTIPANTHGKVSTTTPNNVINPPKNSPSRQQTLQAVYHTRTLSAVTDCFNGAGGVNG
jgi:hypothetical protein